MELRPSLDSQSPVPLYRQLSEYLQHLIEEGDLHPGDRLPPTRELAGLLGLNRNTVAAAYDLLESEGLIRGEVGRGSFVSKNMPVSPEQMDWNRILTASPAAPTGAPPDGVINFTSSRPSEKLFPIEEFRECCREVLESPEVNRLLQLGSPSG